MAHAVRTAIRSAALNEQPRHACHNFIAGRWEPADGCGTQAKRDPSSPSRTLAEVPASGPVDVARAAAAAEAAFSDWAASPAPLRGAVLGSVADQLESRSALLARTVSQETGKPIAESTGEVERAVSILRFFAGEGRRALGERYQQETGGAVFTVRRPVGPVALITPWNFPIAIPVWKSAAALAYGNTVVLKLASDASLSGLELARCFDAARAPDGVLNVITGSGSMCGPALLRQPEIRAVSFTGSEGVGHSIRELAGERGIRAQLELGGHSPLIVMADAALDRAVDGAFRGAFSSQGQKCTSTRRIYVQEEIADAFREALLERIGAARLGHPLAADTEIGPLVNEQQMKLVLEAIEDAKREGARVLAGGHALPEFGYLVEPTLLEGLFGPVVAIHVVANLDEALTRANETRFGLSAAIYTSDLASAVRFTREMHAGVLHVNSPTAGAEPHVPFGGLKASGWGPHEQGRAAIEFYTDLVTVYEDL
jgi:aldehyde dehydrogenase (NAD+)